MSKGDRGILAALFAITLLTSCSSGHSARRSDPICDASPMCTAATAAAEASAADVAANDAYEAPRVVTQSDKTRAKFALRIAGVESPYRIMSAFVLPGQTLAVETADADAKSSFAANASAGSLARTGPHSWHWTAPSRPGSHRIRVTDKTAGESVEVRAFVLQPYAGEDSMGSYRIGRYEREPLKGNPAYLPPRGFVQVTAENVDAQVSPHFKLGQFLCKQQGPFPKYLALQTALLVKLERLLEEMERKGIKADTLHVMSGYRTPHYNSTIGNETSYSRHAYGDAADVFVDNDGDGNMDDINRDGRIDNADAKILYELVETVLEPGSPSHMHGGLAVYKANAAHGPFVHVDTRGSKARW
ncbi:MAG TPA: D-Ala-D-Ala carboxypeptidase family metallohydrolase [Candidatus Limnocylindrales bacterium]|nr:D-Ala-D-Ala carboxypeptidase family metallohydrolase [Candidatus Limnocylindrales bacterium]